MCVWGGGGGVCLCVCAKAMIQQRSPCQPVEKELGEKVPWDTRVESLPLIHTITLIITERNERVSVMQRGWIIPSYFNFVPVCQVVLWCVGYHT